MNEPIIDEHALKHGLSPDDIAYAWLNFAAKVYRGAPNEGEAIALGYDRAGRPIEMVGIERAFWTVVFHAISPPTKNALRELGLVGGRKWLE